MNNARSGNCGAVSKRIWSDDRQRNESFKGELGESPLAWSPVCPPHTPRNQSQRRNTRGCHHARWRPPLFVSERNEMSTRVPLNKIRVPSRTKRSQNYRRGATAAFERASEAQYGSQGAASPVRRIDPKTGLVVPEAPSAETIRQSLGPKLAARL